MSQTLPFTCGPAALLQMLRWRGNVVENCRLQQLKVWRQANTIVMGQGPAGCDSFGLAVAAAIEYECRLSVIRVKANFAFQRTVRNKDQKHLLYIGLEDNKARFDDIGLQFNNFEEDFHSRIKNIDSCLYLLSMRIFSNSNEYHWIAARRRGKNLELYDPLQAHKLIGINTVNFNYPWEFFCDYKKFIIDILY